MITYRFTSSLKIQRASVPQFPFWGATIISPYGRQRSRPLAIDYLELTASAPGRSEVTVCSDSADQLSREELVSPLRSPLFIDASGEAEAVHRQGAAAAGYAESSRLEPITLISTEGALPEGGSCAIAVWPLDFDRLEALLREASDRTTRWGVIVPVLHPVTTALPSLERVADLAGSHRAHFLTAVAIDLEPSAKQTLATMAGDDLDEQGYLELFHTDLETIGVATERHVAALATDRGLEDFVVPPAWKVRSNWNAAVALTLAATRLIRMKREVELGWTLIRSAQQIALLDKPVERVAAAIGLANWPALDPAAAAAIEEWIEKGSSTFFTGIDQQWRLRRDLMP